jgi:hypothetical protein
MDNPNTDVRRLISISITATDPSDASTYTFADVSGDAPGTVTSKGDINLRTAGSSVPTMIQFTLAENIHDYAAFDTRKPTKNIAIEASTLECDKDTGVPPNWVVGVSSDGYTLSVLDPNDPSQPNQYAYCIHLKGRHGDKKHNMPLDPKIQNF